jgi:hypothetical protein
VPSFERQVYRQSAVVSERGNNRKE